MKKDDAKLWEIFSVAGLIFGPLTVALNWQELPVQVPFHFGFFGQVDHWAPKESLLFLPVLSAATYLLLSFAQRHPERSNIPWKLTEANRTEMLALVKRLLTKIKLLAVFTLSYLQWAIVAIALGQMNGLGVWFGPIMLFFTFAPLVLFLIAGNKLNAVNQ